MKLRQSTGVDVALTWDDPPPAERPNYAVTIAVFTAGILLGTPRPSDKRLVFVRVATRRTTELRGRHNAVNFASCLDLT